MIEKRAAREQAEINIARLTKKIVSQLYPKIRREIKKAVKSGMIGCFVAFDSDNRDLLVQVCKSLEDVMFEDGYRTACIISEDCNAYNGKYSAQIHIGW